MGLVGIVSLEQHGEISLIILAYQKYFPKYMGSNYDCFPSCIHDVCTFLIFRHWVPGLTLLLMMKLLNQCVTTIRGSAGRVSMSVPCQVRVPVFFWPKTNTWII